MAVTRTHQGWLDREYESILFFGSGTRILAMRSLHSSDKFRCPGNSKIQLTIRCISFLDKMPGSLGSCTSLRCHAGKNVYCLRGFPMNLYWMGRLVLEEALRILSCQGIAESVLTRTRSLGVWHIRMVFLQGSSKSTARNILWL